MKYVAVLILALVVPSTAWALDETITGTLYDFGAIKSFSNSDGTSGTIYDFGNIKSYQDSCGTTGTLYDFDGITTYQFTTPKSRSAPPAQTLLPSLSDEWRRGGFPRGDSSGRRER